MHNTELNFEDMKHGIDKAGGLFYQYRPCRRDVATIYDIENIRHGVVYAQTPLNMNDPFDSMIGYSPEKMYENCISMLVEELNIEDESFKFIISQFLKYKAVGKLAEFICMLNDLKKYLFSRQVSMHQVNVPIIIFIRQNLNTLYAKCPKKIKGVLSKEVFAAFLLIVSDMESVNITEDNLADMLKLDNVLDELYEKAVDIKDNVYIPTLRTFLSKLTVSCFSVSGWDNQLMWSHYANSYAGICIEYDFNQIKDVIGFIYPVEYTTERPTLSLQDLGVAGFNLGSEASVRSCEPNMGAILSYLLAKNVCWNYEKEWRIINIGEENTPLFIDLPFVKSITFGMNMDPICKQLLWDVCKEKGIECYEIEIGTENYELRRKYLSKKDFTYDIDLELNYIDILTKQISVASERIGKMGENIENEIENKNFSNVSPMLSDTLDMLSNSYYLKISLNRICEHETEELSSTGMPNEILNNISLVNTFVSQAKEMCVALKENMPIFLLGGLIKGHEYTIINKQLGDIHELVGKFENIEWNSFCIKIVSEDTENNSEYSEVDDVVKISE
ncbi:DUF2971 domain-containing protein [Roseburia sp.]|uniref:DUF2971 domain-containing protein n=1 Tax=Roseburia sp. TaxID=2049040 RepID=UPI0035226218